MNKERNKIYFASDFHLGNATREENLEKERKIVEWLNYIAADAKEIYLLGDIFDFWFEYKYVVPKGFVRFLGTLAQLSDLGVKIHLYCGNHDLWAREYLQEEVAIELHHHKEIITLEGKTFMIGHGDGLDAKDKKYKFINTIFKNKTCIKAFASLHPRWAIVLAHSWSKSSRASHSEEDKKDLGTQEPIYKYCIKALEKQHIDFFIFGHRHLACDKALNKASRYINLGNWERGGHYGVWDGENLALKKFD